MSASGKPGWDTMFAPQVDGFPKATLNDLASVEALITERTAAVMLEPAQGEAGGVPAPGGFFRGPRAPPPPPHLLLIPHQNPTRMGRTGQPLSLERFAPRADQSPGITSLC